MNNEPNCAEQEGRTAIVTFPLGPLKNSPTLLSLLLQRPQNQAQGNMGSFSSQSSSPLQGSLKCPIHYQNAELFLLSCLQTGSNLCKDSCRHIPRFFISSALSLMSSLSDHGFHSINELEIFIFRKPETNEHGKCTQDNLYRPQYILLN